MIAFHATIRPYPRQCESGISAHWQGYDLPALRVLGNANSDAFAFTYEELADRLNEIPRMHLELDGSFVWVNAEAPAERINGQITDNGSSVMYIETRGQCQRQDIERILVALGWPQTPLAFQLHPEAILVACQDFLNVF